MKCFGHFLLEVYTMVLWMPNAAIDSKPKKKHLLANAKN